MSTEMGTARKLVTAALAAGYTVSVYDGEEWTVKRSTKHSEIVGALASTGIDNLRIRKADGESVGVIALVWGNSPEELISDYTDNEAIAALVKAAE